MGKEENFEHHQIGMSTQKKGGIMRGSIWILTKLSGQSIDEWVDIIR